MEKVRRFVRVIDTFSEWTGRIASWITIVIIGVVVFEVVMRYVFNRPTTWAYETSFYLYAFLFMLGMAYTLSHKGHVNIEVVVSRLSPRVRAIIEVVCYLAFFFTFNTVLFVWGVDFARFSWAIREVTRSPWAPPVYPLKTLIPVAVFLLLLQGVAEFIRQLNFAIRGKES